MDDAWSKVNFFSQANMESSRWWDQCRQAFLHWFSLVNVGFLLRPVWLGDIEVWSNSNICDCDLQAAPFRYGNPCMGFKKKKKKGKMWLLAQRRKHWACYDSQTCNHNSAINAHVLVAEWLYFDLWPTGELEEEMENPEMVDLPEKQKHQLRHRELFLSRQLESLPATHIRWNRLCVRVCVRIIMDDFP